MTEIAKYNGMMSYLTRPPAPKTQVADLVDDLEPGALKDELKEKFDPSQETYEEYLRRERLGERPFNASEGGSPLVPKPKPYTLEQFQEKADLYIKGALGGFDKDEMINLLQKQLDKAEEAGILSREEAINFLNERTQQIKEFIKNNPGEADLSRVKKAIGGGVIEGEDLGTREGFRKPTSVQKMSVSDALEEIFDLGKGGTPNTKFRDREELKALVEEKIGTKINKNILKASRYPILNYAEYDTANLMKEKMAANKKVGKLSKKESTAQAQIKKQNRINLFKANLGVDIEIGPNNEIIGLDEELKTRLNNASKRFRENKLNTEGVSAFDDPNFFKYFDTEYRTADERLKATAEKYGYTIDEWNELDETQKKRLYAQEFQQKIRINRGEVPGGLSINEIVDQAYEGKKIPGQGPAAKALDPVYETLFRQEYDKLAEGGDPFSKADLSRRVIDRIKEMFGRPGQDVPLSLFPANTDQLTDSSAKSYYQYIDPKTQRGSKKNKIFSDYELELFDGNTASSLNKTKTQEKIFDIITKGPIEIDELSKKLEMTPNNIRSEINRLLTNAIVRVNKPVFLKGKEDLISTLVNNLEATETLDGEWNRSLKYIIYSQIPDPVAQKQAFDKIDEFDTFIKTVQEKFPGVQVQYDHPAGYTALKNQNFRQFLNITPIAQDINNLKSTFDSRSNQNLLAMNEAKAAGDNKLYNELLNKQTKLENTWSKLTGGTSSLGKIRLEGVEDFGTTRLDDPKKDLFGEFQDNIKIRQNIFKNLTDDIKKDIIDVLPRKDRETAVIKSLENITDPDLIKQDKDVLNYIKKISKKTNVPVEEVGKDLTNVQKVIRKMQGQMNSGIDPKLLVEYLGAEVKDLAAFGQKYGGDVLAKVGKGAAGVDLPIFQTIFGSMYDIEQDSPLWLTIPAAFTDEVANLYGLYNKSEGRFGLGKVKDFGKFVASSFVPRAMRSPIFKAVSKVGKVGSLAGPLLEAGAGAYRFEKMKDRRDDAIRQFDIPIEIANKGFRDYIRSTVPQDAFDELNVPESPGLPGVKRGIAQLASMVGLADDPYAIQKVRGDITGTGLTSPMALQRLYDRQGLDKGGPPDPSKRTFLKLLGLIPAGIAGLASLRFGPKKIKNIVTKIEKLKNTKTLMPDWFPTFVDKFRKEGKAENMFKKKKVAVTEQEYNQALAEGKGQDYFIDPRTPEYIAKNPDHSLYNKLVETDELIGTTYTNEKFPGVEIDDFDGEVQVNWENDYSQPVNIVYVKPGGTGPEMGRPDKFQAGIENQEFKPQGEFSAMDQEVYATDPDGGYDTEAVIVDSLDDMMEGTTRQMEEYATGKKVKNLSRGEGKVIEAEVRANQMAEEVGGADYEGDPINLMDDRDYGDAGFDD